ncbi:MAG: hypothetical protein IT480_06470 [Gammaproteobacteria bacterium]|nr:hypothetical protein [Gammaproteobacteria bacterium]
MTVAAVAGAAISVTGSMIAGNQAKKAAQGAANAQYYADQAAIAEQRRQYDQTREDNAPWRLAGEAALNRLQDPRASFQASPGYQFAFDQGQQAVERARAATGNLASGNTLTELTRYGQGMASQEYGNWWNQQAGLAGVGQNAVNQITQAGMNSANNISSALQDQGDARASGINAAGNANANMIGSFFDAAGNLVTRGINFYNNNRLQPVEVTAGRRIP